MQICERTVDVRWPQVVEQVLGRTKTPSRNPNLQDTAEHIFDVLVPDMVEQLVILPNTVSQDRMRQRTAEQTVDTSDPQVVEKLVEVSKVFPKHRIQQRFVEQTIEIPDVTLAEKIVEGSCCSDGRKHATGSEHGRSARRQHCRSGDAHHAVHRQGRGHPCCGAETDLHGPDCSEEYRDFTVAIL